MSDWFRNKTWSEAIESDFMSRLQETTPKEQQVLCLKIQGDLWLGSQDEGAQRTGMKLLQKLIHEYSQEFYEVAATQDIIGNYYYQRADFDKAEPYLQTAFKFYREYKRTGVIRKADLMLAEIILLRNETGRLDEAWQLVINFPHTDGSLTEDYEQYNYYELQARIAHKLGKETEATEYAQLAIALAKTIELDFMIGKPAALEKLYERQPSLGNIAGIV